MRYFFDEWSTLKKELIGKQLILFLDFDGTLAPIADTPEKAGMTPDMIKILTALSKSSACRVAAISGRMLSDLKQKINIPGITCVGTHGLEIEDPGIDSRKLISEQYMDDLAAIKPLLLAKLSSVKGISLEDKKVVLTVHYRSAAYTDAILAKNVFMEVCRSYSDRHRVNILEGKKVIEVRPPVQWNKGDAALWYMDKWQKDDRKEIFAVIYAGDDVTDEDAFRAIGKRGLTVKIGDPEGSAARYYLPEQAEVFPFLKKISETL